MENFQYSFFLFARAKIPFECEMLEFLETIYRSYTHIYAWGLVMLESYATANCIIIRIDTVFWILATLDKNLYKQYAMKHRYYTFYKFLHASINISFD